MKEKDSIQQQHPKDNFKGWEDPLYDALSQLFSRSQLREVLTHSSFEGLPAYLSPDNALRINNFIVDMQAKRPEEEMRRKYGDTYWFYYYYRYRSSTQ